MKRTELGVGAKSLARGSTFAAERAPLARTELPRGASKPLTRPRPISPASREQRAKITDVACIVCARSPCHPAHLVDRSLGGCDHPLCVIPLCPTCHRAYDDHRTLDLTPFLEPRFRDEVAHAVAHLGLLRALLRISNRQWEPIP